MTARRDFVAFLSDYGRADEFVGVCHAVMAEIAPEVRVIDLVHDLPPFDVRAAGLALVRSVQYLPECVVLAIVDPGVGTSRRLVAVEVANGALVGPDNGILAPAVAMLGGPQTVVALTNTDYQLEAPGPTFAGRDVMAPAAAHLAAGVPITDLGTPVDPAGLTPGILPLPGTEEGMILCEVLWVDRFGNCQLNVDAEVLGATGIGPGDVVEVRIGDQGRRARWAHTFADAKPSELVVIVDSYGLCALALDRRSASEELRIRAGSAVTLVPPGTGGTEPDPGVESPIQLGRRPEAPS